MNISEIHNDKGELLGWLDDILPSREDGEYIRVPLQVNIQMVRARYITNPKSVTEVPTLALKVRKIQIHTASGSFTYRYYILTNEEVLKDISTVTNFVKFGGF